MNRQDIKTMIDRLNAIDLGDMVDYDNYAAIDSAVTMLEDLGTLAGKLEYDLDNSRRKSEDLERIIITNTESFANKISELQLENANLKQELKEIGYSNNTVL